MKMSHIELNFVHPSFSGRDIDLFFGPLVAEEDGEFIKLEEHWLLAHVMHKCGLFPSVGQARKADPRWNAPIPPGFSSFVVGKKKFKVFILNKFEQVDKIE